MPQGWMGWEVSCHPFLAHSLQSSHQGETSWEEGLSSLLALCLLSPGAPCGHQALGGGMASSGSNLRLDKCPFPQEVPHGAGKLHQPLSRSTSPQWCHSSSLSTSLCGLSCCSCHGLVLSRMWQRARQCPSVPIYFYGQPSCLFFPGEKACIWSRVLPGNGMGLTASRYIAGKHSFLFCPFPAALHGGTAGPGEGPKPSWGQGWHPSCGSLSVQVWAAEHGWREACEPGSRAAPAGCSETWGWEFCPRCGISWDAVQSI